MAGPSIAIRWVATSADTGEQLPDIGFALSFVPATVGGYRLSVRAELKYILSEMVEPLVAVVDRLGREQLEALRAGDDES